LIEEHSLKVSFLFFSFTSDFAEDARKKKNGMSAVVSMGEDGELEGLLEGVEYAERQLQKLVRNVARYSQRCPLYRGPNEAALVVPLLVVEEGADEPLEDDDDENENANEEEEEDGEDGEEEDGEVTDGREGAASGNDDEEEEEDTYKKAVDEDDGDEDEDDENEDEGLRRARTRTSRPRRREIHVLFTLRSKTLRSHAGEVSYPGGKVSKRH